MRFPLSLEYYYKFCIPNRVNTTMHHCTCAQMEITETPTVSPLFASTSEPRTVFPVNSIDPSSNYANGSATIGFRVSGDLRGEFSFWNIEKMMEIFFLFVSFFRFFTERSLRSTTVDANSFAKRFRREHGTRLRRDPIAIEPFTLSQKRVKGSSVWITNPIERKRNLVCLF